jgi:hypothetical protein
MKLEKIDREDAEKRVEKLIEQINILSQFNISENFPFYKSIDSLPFSLIHGDFDSQNILVELVDDDIKFVGVINWKFSRTGTLLNFVFTQFGFKNLFMDHIRFLVIKSCKKSVKIEI